MVPSSKNNTDIDCGENLAPLHMGNTFNAPFMEFYRKCALWTILRNMCVFEQVIVMVIILM